MNCKNCVYYTAWIDGGCCPFWFLEMCDSRSKKKWSDSKETSMDIEVLRSDERSVIDVNG